MKNLLKMSDLTPGELTHILDVADQLKAQQKLGGTAPLLAGKTVAMLPPSPTKQSFRPARVPRRSRMVIRSASTWQGCA